MIGFEKLIEIMGNLGKNGHNLNATKKEELRVFLEEVLDGKEGETSEDIVSAFREKLKTEAKNELKADQSLKDEVKAELSNEIQEKVNKLEQIEKEKTELQTKLEKAENEKQGLQTKFNTANKELEDQNAKVAQLTQKNKELEAKNKTTEQPEQDNKAKYTATVGMGLAAGLVAFTALERTVRLEMLVMVGIAVASAIVAGGITYAVLPSTQVDGAKAQGVNGKGK
ncbi:uncharacterized protein TNIN_36141 [Trichonephila inaurata madagascariensis]|uniref:Uncharacterized protein n=1 Tax=Trichonephila inaurata madagascariensis TaxID=2747483 RepID=A0A8X6Y2Z7_9ARAC|nr:uncharacterized protein TNIN_36141 [Trichonephila inaurata madagascariensis]